MTPTPLPERMFALNFDQFQRMATIRLICEHLVGHGCATAADIGGHPGTLADLLPEGLACKAVIDIPHCERPDSIQGSAMQLPLGDQSIDVILNSDVLEHIDDAPAAVSEMARAAKHAVVITAPWKNEVSENAERTLCRWHEKLTGEPHPWLVEHDDFGLPDVEAVSASLQSAGFKTIRLACGTLQEWTLMQMVTLLAETLPADAMNLDHWNESLNREWPLTLTTALPAEPYRFALVAARDEKILAGFSDEPAPCAAPLEASLPHIGSIFEAVSGFTSGTSSDEQDFERAYRKSLEALTRQQAEEIERLRHRSSLGDRILRKLGFAK